jgi:hypothetical protein
VTAQHRQRPLAITSIIYKIQATIIQARWTKVLPSVIAGCQHGFVYGRRQFENVMKIRDVGAYADMVADERAKCSCPENSSNLLYCMAPTWWK